MGLQLGLEQEACYFFFCVFVRWVLPQIDDDLLLAKSEPSVSLLPSSSSI
jgi:hypothetical protein